MGRTHVLLPDFGAGADILETGATGVARITARERFITGGSHAWALRSFFRNMPLNEPKRGHYEDSVQTRAGKGTGGKSSDA